MSGARAEQVETQGQARTSQSGAASASFAAAVQACAPGLMRLAWRFTRDTEEAKDLVQAALADAWERRSSLEDPHRAAHWLRRILVNRAVNLHRRRKLWRTLQRLLPSGDQQSPVQTAAPAELALDEARRLRAVHLEISRLPPKQAAAVTLRYFEGLPVAEVADALGVNVGTARVHLHRALKKLKPLGAAEDEGVRE